MIGRRTASNAMRWLVVPITALLLAAPLRAEEPTTRPAAGTSATDLAKQTQNPVADLISVPFQNNFNFNAGPENRTVWILNFQPVIPIPLTEKLPINTSLQAFYNAVTPNYGPDWQLRFQVQFLFPR